MPDYDDVQNLRDTSVSVSGGVVTMTFTRDFNTGDSRDMNLGNGQIDVSWATGSRASGSGASASYNKHSSLGHKRVDVLQTATAAAAPQTSAPRTNAPAAPRTDPPVQNTGVSLSVCPKVNSILGGINWSAVNINMPQQNISIPFLGKLVISVQNVQLQGAGTANCAGVGGNGIALSNMPVKITKSDWVWFLDDSNPTNHKGTATADFKAAVSITVDSSMKSTQSVQTKLDNFDLHVDDSHNGLVYDAAFRLFGDQLKSSLQTTISNAVKSRLESCLSDSSCAQSTM
jgi:hypothetical protein